MFMRSAEGFLQAVPKNLSNGLRIVQALVTGFTF